MTRKQFHLARSNLPGLVSDLVSNATNKFERQIGGKGAVRAGKWFTLFIWNKDVNVKITKSGADLGSSMLHGSQYQFLGIFLSYWILRYSISLCILCLLVLFYMY